MVKITTGMGNYGNIKKSLEMNPSVKKYTASFTQKMEENIGSTVGLMIIINSLILL